MHFRTVSFAVLLWGPRNVVITMSIDYGAEWSVRKAAEVMPRGHQGYLWRLTVLLLDNLKARLEYIQ